MFVETRNTGDALGVIGVPSPFRGESGKGPELGQVGGRGALGRPAGSRIGTVIIASVCSADQGGARVM